LRALVVGDQHALESRWAETTSSWRARRAVDPGSSSQRRYAPPPARPRLGRTPCRAHGGARCRAHRRDRPRRGAATIRLPSPPVSPDPRRSTLPGRAGTCSTAYSANQLLTAPASTCARECSLPTHLGNRRPAADVARSVRGGGGGAAATLPSADTAGAAAARPPADRRQRLDASAKLMRECRVRAPGGSAAAQARYNLSISGRAARRNEVG
jgi:hypothetical protein